jgi:hypothetical protein
MDLKVIRVREQGDEKKEYVTIQAKEDCNLEGYMIFDETFKNDGSASNKHRHVFIFPDWEVKKNEWVFLFTCSGKNTRGKTKDSSPASYFYWGLKSPVWNEEGDKVHLIKVESAMTLKVPSVA